MANKIEATNLKNTNFVTGTSRYVTSPIVYYGDNRIVTFTTYKRKPPKFSSSDKFMLVKQGMEYRPDLIAKAAYGVNLISLWWVIMEANGIFDVFDLKAGLTLRIPVIV